MANEETARTYAQAIFEQAVDRWRKSLQAAAEAADKKGVTTQVDNPTAGFDQKKQALNSLLPTNADPEVRNFLYLLGSKNQLHLLPEVLAEFNRFVERGPAHELAWVTSAIPLDERERSQVESKIHGQFGQDLDVEYRVDPSIIGGLVIRVGDRVIDGSVSGKLTAMRQKLEATS